ncbi:bacterial regulatory helix-turn-helix protein, AraC family protein [Asticcacaulis biprosthecium C19]|uniref:Bacterial regulatory helix-turn-helix protein, AraC family protein n=1 Tax=Asticcacaulis biprosthecium C19 TaxID=715226 RepID=F4QJG9_9CAUL|nr:AraC family transcriptional regulator [Asticcacaulis biprosthecium]EGF93152.1 bacterial regulatory helix-turn-helix protein, AraC family protein [Asticcacaulis biprosthecium C19]
MDNPLPIILASAILGQALLCLSLLVARPVRRPVDLPLMVLFSAIATVTSALVLAPALPSGRPFLFAISLPAWLALAPALFVYVEALTCETPWRLNRHHLRHVWAAGLACLTPVLVGVLPVSAREAMLVRGEMVAAPFALFVALVIFGVILLGLVQAAVFVFISMARLSRYRRRLADLFANNERRELWWLSGLIGGGTLVALTIVMAIAADTLMNVRVLPASVLFGLALPALWALAVYGLQQKAGFEDRYQEVVAEEPVPKYRKSALTTDQARRVAARIEAAMQRDRLYLDPTLSLQKLAGHLAIPANTLSQTLNAHMGETFFAYVSRQRVEAAKPLLEAGEHNVLEVALEVGFNSKSAFYKAFRHVTGVTPAGFRQLK